MSKLEVKTRHSTYLIDTDERTLARSPHHPDASDLTQFDLGAFGDDGLIFKEYEAIPGIQVGYPLSVFYRDGSWSRSTLIESITELQESAVPA